MRTRQRDWRRTSWLAKAEFLVALETTGAYDGDVEAYPTACRMMLLADQHLCHV